MLISISFNNILSFGSETAFSLVADKMVRSHPEHVVKIGKKRVLRGAIMFGPNAAGKSNVVKSVELLSRIFYKNSCCVAAGCQFALVAKKKSAMSWIVEYSFRNHVFKYMLSTDGIIVISEKLFLLDNNEELLYSRFNKRRSVRFGNRLKDEKWYAQRTLPKDAILLRKLELDALYLQPENMSGRDVLCAAIEGLHSLNVVHSKSLLAPNVFRRLLNMSDFRDFLKNLMQKSDVGITDMRWQKVSASRLKYVGLSPMSTFSGIKILHLKESFIALQLDQGQVVSAFEFRFAHGAGYWMRADRESEGTLRLMHLSAFLFAMMLTESTWFVDELDCHLHPYISMGLLHNVMVKGVNAQIVVSAHDTNLMTKKLWRMDEVWLVEKRMDGSTNLNTLRQLKGALSKKLSYGYINGLYGAVPHLGGDMI